MSAKVYDAFISYSHVDRAVAELLQRRLERFAKRWYARRRLRVFRDDSHLTATALAPSLRGALDASRYLILLASPEAVASKWVARELEQWIEKAPLRPILLVRVSGEIAWNETAGDFDWTRTTAVPRVLEKRLATEPRFAELAG